jgi:hypothetical protein|tara:strand:- start:1308 stop:1481 length:174 start_codon:yes stop_codon:yes gene_type:complete
MTQYDVKAMYEKQRQKDKVTSLHADHGVLQVRYADGTMAVYKKNKWSNKLKLINKRK